MVICRSAPTYHYSRIHIRCDKYIKALQPSWRNSFAMPKPVSKDIRELVIRHNQEHKTVAEISNILHISPRTVSRIIKLYRETNSLSPKKSTGRPRSTTAEQDAQLASTSRADPFATSTMLREQLHLNVSKDTVKRRLRENKLFGRRAAQKQNLTPANKLDRLRFAEDHINWTADQWSAVIFSDEKVFCSESTETV
ncbi:uncharacterized protein LOC111619363 [Centruroides sculpturatus]|uniref:uncharacterized protein LOC111619363 n=1 Tax=Centruroides sculpturatus TaxID=218467 RepID=UPI000C6E89DC|nr:uncharacterized protein LOC111619363 [Centruroides sculpturatus]